MNRILSLWKYEIQQSITEFVSEIYVFSMI